MAQFRLTRNASTHKISSSGEMGRRYVARFRVSALKHTTGLLNIARVVIRVNAVAGCH